MNGIWTPLISLLFLLFGSSLIEARIFFSVLTNLGGKRWRSTLLLLVAEAYGKSAEDVVDFVVITEIIHNGSLIVDDIEDDR